MRDVGPTMSVIITFQEVDWGIECAECIVVRVEGD